MSHFYMELILLLSIAACCGDRLLFAMEYSPVAEGLQIRTTIDCENDPVNLGPEYSFVRVYCSIHNINKSNINIVINRSLIKGELSTLINTEFIPSVEFKVLKHKKSQEDCVDLAPGQFFGFSFVVPMKRHNRYSLKFTYDSTMINDSAISAESDEAFEKKLAEDLSLSVNKVKLEILLKGYLNDNRVFVIEK